jgi:uncharacterized membrane protein YraQ (UPF0718 family)
MRLLNELGRALLDAESMTWQITWSLILGFTLSAVIQAVVRREAIARHPGSGNTRTLALATGLGAAAMAFEIASTNLVIELAIILALLISWQFTLAEFTGGPIMIVLMAVAFRLPRRAGGQSHRHWHHLELHHHPQHHLPAGRPFERLRRAWRWGSSTPGETPSTTRSRATARRSC